MKDSSLFQNEILVKEWNSYKNHKSNILIDITIFKNHIIESLKNLKENN
jgi:hypothetical protein